MAEEKSLTLSEAAPEVHLAEDTLRKYSQKGTIPAFKIGGRWYVSAAWVNERKTGQSRPSEKKIKEPLLVVGSTPKQDSAPEAKATTEAWTAVQVDPEMAKLRQSHHDEMVGLVKRWSGELNPQLSRFPLRDLNDSKTLTDPAARLHGRSLWDMDGGGYHYYLLWQVFKEGIVYLSYPLEVATERETRIVRGYLHQHLRSSPYHWLLEGTEKGIKKWKQIGGAELMARAQLLNRIDRAVEKLNHELAGKRNPLADPYQIKSAGLTTWFSESIRRMVLDAYYRGMEYNIEPFERGLFKVRYGDTCLGLATTTEDGEAYIGRHKELMSTFAESEPVAAIKRLMTVRESLTSDMRDALTKLVVDKVLPGKCDSPVCHGGGEWGNGNGNPKRNG